MAASIGRKNKVEIEMSDSASEESFDDSNSLSGQDADADGSDSESTESAPNASGKTGLADVLAKILHKNVPAHKQVILSKGKTDKEIQKRKLEREQEEEETGNKAKRKPLSSGAESQLSREEKVKIWENMCRSKPDPLDRDKERQLQKVATRGVVQLFNAVRKQQKVLEEQIQQVGSSERKKDKVMEGMTRDKFLSILKGTSNTNVKTEKPEELASEPKVQKTDRNSNSKDKGNHGDKTWNILKDDYMMGAKMKDWDQEGDDDSDAGDDSGPDDPDLSDSD